MISSLKLFVLISIIHINCFSQTIFSSYSQFSKTPVYELAKAAQFGRLSKIKEISNNKKIDFDYREPENGHTVLMVAVMNKDYRVMNQLLKCGANPNIRDSFGLTALMYQVSDWYVKTLSFRGVKLLLKFGADINAINNTSRISEQGQIQKRNSSILIDAVGYYNFNSSRKIKLLIKHGANPNIKVGIDSNCVLSRVLFTDNIELVHYLVLDLKVNIPKYCVAINNKKYNILEMLRMMIFKLGSKKHKLKMEVVNYLKDNYGLDYFKEPVTGHILETIQETYPKDWEEFIKKY